MTAHSTDRVPVIMIHDGAIDEFVAAALLAASPQVDLLGVVVVNADCIGSIACQVMNQVNAIAQVDVQVALSKARGENPFPWPYRSDCVSMADLGQLRNQHGSWVAPPDGDELLNQLLDTCSHPVTIMCTGPVTPLTMSLREDPHRADRIKEVIWMGGAIDVAGNLDPTQIPPLLANSRAEWNVFWDPSGTQEFFDLYSGPITLIPLDVTNAMSIDNDFRSTLLGYSEGHPFARLCYSAYELVKDEPFYRLWDTTAASYLLNPHLFAPSVVSPRRVITDPTLDMGALVESPTGKPLHLVLELVAGGKALLMDAIAHAIGSVGQTTEPA